MKATSKKYQDKILAESIILERLCDDGVPFGLVV